MIVSQMSMKSKSIFTYGTMVGLLTMALSSCTTPVSCNLGESLDAIGKEVITTHQRVANKTFYKLDGCYYARVRLAYQTHQPGIFKASFFFSEADRYGSMTDYVDGFLLMSAIDVHHQLKRSVQEPPASARRFIPEAEFDLTKAKYIDHPGCPHMCRIYGCSPVGRETLHPLTLSVEKPSPYPGVPVKRTTGNYARTPLVALLSYGVDAPITIVGSTLWFVVMTPVMALVY